MDGNTVEGMPEMPVTVTFEERDGRTALTDRARFAWGADLEATLAIDVEQGMTESLDCLEAALAAMCR